MKHPMMKQKIRVRNQVGNERTKKVMIRHPKKPKKKMMMKTKNLPKKNNKRRNREALDKRRNRQALQLVATKKDEERELQKAKKAEKKLLRKHPGKK